MPAHTVPPPKEICTELLHFLGSAVDDYSSSGNANVRNAVQSITELGRWDRRGKNTKRGRDHSAEGGRRHGGMEDKMEE